MPSNYRKPLPSETQQVLERQPNELNRVVAAMVAASNRIGRPFSEARMDQLIDDLAGYSVEAIEWAMDQWGRTAEKLPTLANILKLLDLWKQDHKPHETCPIECRTTHGTGYGTNDVLWLFKKIQAIKALHSRKPTKDEYRAMFKELNASRQDGTPEHFKGMENWL